MKIKLNEDKELVNKIREKLKANGGFCPCVLEKSDDTKCMCKQFREQVSNDIAGECHCGLWVATQD